MCANSMRFFSLIILFVALLLSHAESLLSQSEKIVLPREATQIERLNERKSGGDGAGHGQAVSAFSLIPDSLASGVHSDKAKPLQPHGDAGLRLFTTLDFSLSPPLPANIVAKQVVPGRYASVYVDTSATFDRSLLEEILFIFEQQIYPTNVTVLSSAAQISHPIALLFADIPAKEGEFFSGYTLSRTAKQHANSDTTNDDHTIIIHTQLLKQDKRRLIASVLARELAHLICRENNPNEIPWITAGIGQYAVFLNGYGKPARLTDFLKRPDRTLTAWQNRPENYARAFSFILFLAERLEGEAVIPSLVAEPQTGIAGLQSVIKKHNDRLSFELLFKAWIVANYLNARRIAAPGLGYDSIDLPQTSWESWESFPATDITVELRPWSAQYLTFRHGKNLVLNVEIENSAAIAASAVKIDNDRVVEIVDLEFDDRGSQVLPFRGFGETFDELVFIPYHLGGSSLQMVTLSVSAQAETRFHTFRDTLGYHVSESSAVYPLAFPGEIAEHILSGWAVRFTAPHDAYLSGAEFALWNPKQAEAKLEIAVYDVDNDGMPGVKRDSVRMQTDGSGGGRITWQSVEFQATAVPLARDVDFYLGFELQNTTASDTCFAILDTGRAPTDRSLVLTDDGAGPVWRGIEGGQNFFARAIISVPADADLPQLDIGVEDSESGAMQITVSSSRPLNPQTVTGQLQVDDTTSTLAFMNKDGLDLTFWSRPVQVQDRDTLQVVISARHRFGTRAGADTLTFIPYLYDAASGVQVSSPDGIFQAWIPPAALETARLLFSYKVDQFRGVGSGSEVIAEDGLSYAQTGLIYALAPLPLSFDDMAEIDLIYAENPQANLAENRLAVGLYADGVWTILGGELYRQNKTIRVLSTRGGIYTLLITQAGSGESIGMPEDFFLQQNYPNPFNPSTTIRFGLPKSGHITLRIINLKGQTIATLRDQVMAAGEYVVEWDGTDDGNLRVASGVYLYQLETQDFVETKKLVLVK